MPRPTPKFVTFEIDGREVTAPEGSMLVDAAKYGDVEIPYFCYEPKLGAPVGACRMCLVEIEGMPKLQTACSTAVKDGMVVNTTPDRVKAAQNAIVEFLLINHPLDCPVCDKGGECPLQDITFGWGSGRSRFIEPKRHFKKPLELSPLVAIDRERCILCYRCVRFSQEISEDYQLVFLERGDHTYVGTHDGRPYVGPFSGNITELCPVGALTSTSFRFRARPWDVEDAGTVCTICPSQCNVELTIRDDTKVVRVMARDNVEVDDGWLCDRGRYGFQAFHAPERITQPLVRDGGELRPVSWERALSEAQSALDRAGERTAALVGGEATNEEGYLVQFLMRNVLGSPHVDSRMGGVLDPEQARVLARPDLTARVSDLDYAGAIVVLDTELVDEMPILDLRVRKAARRTDTPVVVATSHPSTLDPNAAASLRFAPGASEAVLAGLVAALSGEGDLDDLARRAGATADGIRGAAEALRDAGDVVVIWGERVTHGPRGAQATAALLALARALGIENAESGGLIEVPSGTNGRGLREVGCLPNMKPGLAESDDTGIGAAGMPSALGDELGAVLLFQADPVRFAPDGGAWAEALDRANAVVAFSDFVTPSLAEYANVVFPAEAYAEKEGTVTHPDGRIQRVRQGVAKPGEVRSQSIVLQDLISALLGSEFQLSVPAVFNQLTGTIPFYGGLTYEEIGGRGLRWQERDEAGRLAQTPLPSLELETPPELPRPGDGALRLGTVPSLWASREADHAPSLRFLAPLQRVEMSVADARARDIAPGDLVEVVLDGTRVRANASLRSGVPAGTVFMLEGTGQDNANVLMNGAARAVEVRKVPLGTPLPMETQPA
jgi:NADH-quinone oxidoreductase subunit G